MYREACARGATRSRSRDSAVSCSRTGTAPTLLAARPRTGSWSRRSTPPDSTEEDVATRNAAVIDHTQRDPWSVAQEQFGIAADKLHLDPNMRAILAGCQREPSVPFPG